MINSSSPEVSRALARFFNEKKIFLLSEREKMIEKYDSIEEMMGKRPIPSRDRDYPTEN